MSAMTPRLTRLVRDFRSDRADRDFVAVAA